MIRGGLVVAALAFSITAGATPTTPVAFLVADQPAGLAVDAVGNLYAAANGGASLLKVTPSGTVDQILDFTGDCAGNTLDGPSGGAVDGSGNVYVTAPGIAARRKPSAGLAGGVFVFSI